MDKTLRDSLAQLGLSTKEIQFLEALYALGPSTVQEVTKKSRLQRSTAYLVLDDLIQKGFIQEDFKDYKKTIVALEPKSLLRMLSAKQRVIRRQEIELEENLPALEALYKSSHIRPNVQFFEGKKAVLAIWDDVLSTKGEILLWTNQATENLFFSNVLHEKFIKERVKKQIPIRALAVNNIPGKKLLEKDALSFRHSKLLPIQTTFRAETYIYDNKVAILDHQNDVIGIIIQSDAITSTQKAIFEMTWNTTK